MVSKPVESTFSNAAGQEQSEIPSTRTQAIIEAEFFAYGRQLFPESRCGARDLTLLRGKKCHSVSQDTLERRGSLINLAPETTIAATR